MSEKEIEKKDVEVKSNETKPNTEKKPLSPKTKKIILFSGIGAAVIAVIVILAAIFIPMLTKPSKKVGEELSEAYLRAIRELDGDLLAKNIDVKGYIIFNDEDGIKKFDSRYKNKDTYIKKYLKDKNYEDVKDAESAIITKFKSKYRYGSKEYTFKKIVSIEKSSKSKKIYVVKSKIEVKSAYSSTADTKTMKLYVIRVDGEYKIVGAEIE